jgi:hypothetical protein
VHAQEPGSFIQSSVILPLLSATFRSKAAVVYFSPSRGLRGRSELSGSAHCVQVHGA